MQRDLAGGQEPTAMAYLSDSNPQVETSNCSGNTNVDCMVSLDCSCCMQSCDLALTPDIVDPIQALIISIDLRQCHFTSLFSSPDRPPWIMG